MQSMPAFTTPAALAPASSFIAHNAVISRSFTPLTVAPSSRRANITMRSDANLQKKIDKVAAVVKKLEASQMIFATDAAGLSVKDVVELKNLLPATTVVSTVKNSLMCRAIADSKWESAGDFTTQSNMWFFVGDDMKGTWDVYKKFAKVKKREQPKGGVFEGTSYDGSGISAIAALPSKLELITKVAVAINMVPTKLGRSVKAVPTKLAKAVKLAVADESEDAPAAE